MKKEQEDNPIKKDLDALVELFKQSLPDLKIEFVDERLTTFEAGQFRGFDKRGSRSDDLAAKIILQRYFDSL
jgi:RNase H-fold protein (predicted Holliday junction resolvase)